MHAKYIKTKYDQIIIFPESMAHTDFKKFNPISAGNINFYTNSNGIIKANCSGKSVSLGITSNEEEDSRLATIQLVSFY